MKSTFIAMICGTALLAAPSFAEDVHPLFKQGKWAYDNLCSHCHGKEMVNPGTSSFDLRKFPLDEKQRFYDAVNDGSGDMPAWKDVLIEGELDAIWVYVATRAGKEPFPEDAPAAAPAKADAAPLPEAEVADLVAKGKAAYFQLCEKCHGKDLINPGTSSFDLRQFPTDQKERFYDAVLNGRGDMPAWADILVEGELDALWAYVATRAGAEPYPQEQSSAPAPRGAMLAELMTPETLTVCLARGNGVLSGKRSTGGAGFDYRLAAEIAEHLDLELQVTWFESEQEEESDPVRETYAQLSEPLCDMTASHPLYESAIGQPPAATASLPRWDDMPDWWGTRRTTLKPVAATAPYMRAEIGLALGPGAPESVTGLDGIGDLTLGLQQGTLSGAIVLLQAPADVIARARTFDPGSRFLWHIENGEADLAIVDIPAFDGHRKQNPITKLRLADWRHPFGVNIGFAVAAEDEALLGRINDFLAAPGIADRIAAIAAEEGVTWAPPRAPWVRGRITRAELAAMR